MPKFGAVGKEVSPTNRRHRGQINLLLAILLKFLCDNCKMKRRKQRKETVIF